VTDDVVARALRRHFIDQAIDAEVFGGRADARRWALAVIGLLGLIGTVAALLLLPDVRVKGKKYDIRARRGYWGADGGRPSS
jgi:hypothetical protein